MNQQYRDADTGEHPGPEWLSASLRSAGQFFDLDAFRKEPTPVSQTFEEQCALAANTVYALHQMREQQRKMKFVPMPLPDHVERLADAAGVSIREALAWLGVTEVSEVMFLGGTRLGQLARRLGLGLQEALALTEAGYAETKGMEPMTLLAASARGNVGSGTQLAQCESMLARIRESYDCSTREELDAILDELEQAY